MKKQYITKSEILGAFGKWILRQYPYVDYQKKLFFPALSELQKCLDNWEDQSHEVLAILDLKDFVRSIISVCPAIKEYNRNENERLGGEETPEFMFTSRYDSPKPEYDFIDIDALERNIIRELSE